MRNILKKNRAATTYGINRVTEGEIGLLVTHLDIQSGRFVHFGGVREWIRTFWRKYLIRMFVTKRHRKGQ